MQKTILFLIFIFSSFSISSAEIHDATKRGDYDKVRQLLLNGEDVNSALRNGFTVLHMAAQENRKDIAGLLIENGVDINATMSNGMPPIFIAIDRENIEIVELLIANNAVYSIGAMNLALSRSKFKMFKLLVSNKHYANLQGKTNNTILHSASVLGNSKAVEYLLKLGADPKSTNNQGDTPLSALYKQKEKLTPFLLRASKEDIKNQLGVDIDGYDKVIHLLKAAMN